MSVRFHTFIQKNLIQIFVVCTTILTLILVCFIKAPAVTGDGNEYFMMLESFYSHQSFEMRDSDAKNLATKALRSNPSQSTLNYESRMSGYFETDNGQYYSYHFWGYSLINLPIKFILNAFNLDEIRVFQITNALILITFLFWTIKNIKIENIYHKLLFLLLMILNPAIWYIIWTHPELMSYIFVLWAIFLFQQKRYSASLILTAIVSMQNPPVIFLTLFHVLLMMTNLVRKKYTGQELIKSLSTLVIPFFITLIPFFYSYINFKTSNPIMAVGGSNWKFITWQKPFELIFDPNLGILSFMPITLIICLIFYSYASIKIFMDWVKSKSIHLVIINNSNIFYLFGLILTTFCELVASATTSNWNHGAMGPSRYTLWSLIPLFMFTMYLIISNFDKNFYKKMIVNIVIASLIVNAAIVFYALYDKPYEIKFTKLSEFILNTMPTIYNPTPQIFIDRTKLLSPSLNQRIYYYKNNGNCKKALLIDYSEKDYSLLTQQCGSTPRLNAIVDQYYWYSF